ncbi:MAG: hypothetical protein HY904_24995 [Deltaproteobacteria bacterium]|nr:hypothetical protein [Deltaproteobacteria bacterium]
MTLTDERLLRSSVGAVWLLTAVTCVFPSYQAVGNTYLSRLGLGPSWMYATCVAEGVVALVVLARPTGAWLTALQVAAVTVFTLVLAVMEPMLLVSPFGFLSKNVPFVLVAWAAWELGHGDPQDRARRLVRSAAALPWLTEGLLPKILFQQGVELALVPRLGLSTSPALVVGALGVAQLLSGVAALLLRGGALRAVLAAQAAALVLLPVVIGALEPALWVHPFGPFSKNLPILAATLVAFRSTR